MKNLKLFLIGRFSSFIGNGIFLIVLPIYLLEKTSSAAFLGKFLAIIYISVQIFNPFIGNFIENKNKKNIMIVTDFLQFLIYMILYFTNISSNFFLFGLIIALSGILTNIFDISTSSIFSIILPNHFFEKGNSYKSIADNAALLISPVLGIFLYIKFGLHFIFLINAITFLLSGIVECFIVYEEFIKSERKGKIFENLLEIKEFVVKDKELLNLFLLSMLLNFVMGSITTVILPYFFLNVVKISKEQFSIIMSAVLIGSTMGASLIIFKRKTFSIISLVNSNSILVISIGIISFFSSYKIYFAIIFLLLITFGLIVSLVSIPLISSFQRNVPIKMQGRFFGIRSFFSGLLVPLGQYLFGLSTEIIIPQILLIIQGGIMLIVTTIIFLKQNKIK